MARQTTRTWGIVFTCLGVALALVYSFAPIPSLHLIQESANGAQGFDAHAQTTVAMLGYSLLSALLFPLTLLTLFIGIYFLVNAHMAQRIGAEKKKYSFFVCAIGILLFLLCWALTSALPLYSDGFAQAITTNDFSIHCISLAQTILIPVSLWVCASPFIVKSR